MRNIYYLVAACLLALGSCRNNDKMEEKQAGFVIHGTLGELPDASLAILSYKQQDSAVIDSAMIKNGEFTFRGQLRHPVEASIRLRHGKHFPEGGYHSDSFNFYLDTSEMQLSTGDSIKNAVLKGSVLTDQSREIAGRLRPFTDEIMSLYDRMEGRSQEDKLRTHDTIQLYVDSIQSSAKKFIDAHPDSYVALQRFLQHGVPKNFDPIAAEVSFHKFPEHLRNTPTGEKIAKIIAVAKKSMIGEQAMDFTQTTLDGEEFQLSSLRGKYVLIDFWAAWCKPCRAENPNLVKAYNTYKGENFEIVGVSLDAGKEMWRAAVEKDGLEWIHVSDLKYWDNEVAIQYGITSVPASILIDPDGVIIAKNLRGQAVSEKLAELFDRS